MWNKRKEAGEFSFEVPNHPISHTTTEEAMEGQKVYDKFMAEKKAEMEARKKEAEERKRKLEEKKKRNQ